MATILVIAEQAHGKLKKATLSALTAAQQLAAKKVEVNQIASVIGRQAVDGRGQPVSATATTPSGSQVVEVADSNAQPYTRNSIARALSGQPLRR